MILIELTIQRVKGKVLLLTYKVLVYKSVLYKIKIVSCTMGLEHRFSWDKVKNPYYPLIFMQMTSQQNIKEISHKKSKEKHCQKFYFEPYICSSLLFMQRKNLTLKFLCFLACVKLPFSIRKFCCCCFFYRNINKDSCKFVFYLKTLSLLISPRHSSILSALFYIFISLYYVI